MKLAGGVLPPGRRGTRLLRATWLAGVALCAFASGLGCQPEAPRAPSALVTPVERVLPVPLPAEAFLVARWTRPSELLARFRSWAAADVDPLAVWLGRRVGRSRSPIVLDEPIEFVMAIDRTRSEPEVVWALSFGLEGGRVWQRTSREPLDVPSPVGLHCAEAASLGVSQRRLTCAPTPAALRLLLPAATRSLPLLPLGDAPLSFDVRSRDLPSFPAPAMRGLLARWLESALGILPTGAAFETHLSAIASGTAVELTDLLRGLHGAHGELSADDRGLSMEWSLPAASRSQLLATLLGTAASGRPPRDFGADVSAGDRAAFVWSFDAQRLRAWRSPLADALALLLEFRGVPSRLSEQASGLLSQLPIPAGPLWYAAGRPPEFELAAATVGPARLGWHRLRMRGSLADYRRYADELERAFDDPILRSQLQRLVRTALGRHWVPTKVHPRRARSATLPPESFVLELSFAESSGAPSGRTLSTVFVFVPHADGLEVVWGGDEQRLARRVASDPLQPGPVASPRPPSGSAWQSPVAIAGYYPLPVLVAHLARLFTASASPARHEQRSTPPSDSSRIAPVAYSFEPDGAAQRIRFRARLTSDAVAHAFSQFDRH